MNNPTIEDWKPIPGYEGLYSVSNCGRVRAESRTVRHFSGGPKRLKEKLRSPVLSKHGYLSVVLSKEDRQNRYSIHRLVLLAFVGQPDGNMDCCHKDGCKTNNNLENLRWDTRAGNMQDVIAHGRSNRGERCPSNKIPESAIPLIRLDARRQNVIAHEYGVDPSTISSIKSHRIWKHIT